HTQLAHADMEPDDARVLAPDVHRRARRRHGEAGVSIDPALREVAQAGKDRDPRWYRVHRRLSIHVTARLVRTRVTLNQISALMLSLGALGAALNASPQLVVNALGWGCLYGAFLLD